jgi:hypothetical protein
VLMPVAAVVILAGGRIRKCPVLGHAGNRAGHSTAQLPAVRGMLASASLFCAGRVSGTTNPLTIGTTHWKRVTFEPIWQGNKWQQCHWKHRNRYNSRQPLEIVSSREWGWGLSAVQVLDAGTLEPWHRCRCANHVVQHTGCLCSARAADLGSGQGWWS